MIPRSCGGEAGARLSVGFFWCGGLGCGVASLCGGRSEYTTLPSGRTVLYTAASAGVVMLNARRRASSFIGSAFFAFVAWAEWTCQKKPPKSLPGAFSLRRDEAYRL